MKVQNKHRVLHIVDILSLSSGVASVVMNCIKGINQISQDVAVYGFCDDGLKSTIEARGGKVFRLPDIKISFGQKFARCFKQLLQEQSYSIIHGHLLNSAFIYLREAKKQGIQHRIIHAHNSQLSDTALKGVRNKVLAMGIPLWANNYIAVSDAAAKIAFRKNTNVHIIPNGIDANLFRFDPEVRMEVRSELGLSENVLCVGHVARFSPIKKHSFLLEAFRYLRQCSNCVLVLVGDGNLESTIKEKVGNAGLTEFVIFLGLRQDVHRLYQAFDVFMLPSISEGFGLVAVEAQCAGLACLLSEHIPKSVVCSDNIKFLPLRNAEEWAKSTLEMVAQNRTDGSSEVINANLDASTMCANISNIYKTL